jgi:phosphate transport system protein
MSKHLLQKEIENLKKKILHLGAICEDRVRMAIQAIEKRDTDLATNVIARDIEIDNMEVEIEEDCLKILALYQPVAGDLRYIISVLKINNDMERIGDLAVNIAEHAAFLAVQQDLELNLDFSGMAHKARIMLKQSLDALINLSVTLAHSVCVADDEIDKINREMYGRIQEMIQTRPDQIVPLTHLLSVSKHLERIADHATNISEDVIYMINGEIVRHKTEDYFLSDEQKQIIKE